MMPGPGTYLVPDIKTVFYRLTPLEKAIAKAGE